METLTIKAHPSMGGADAERKDAIERAKDILGVTGYDNETARRVESISFEVMEECRKTLMMRFRFFSAALWRMPHVNEAGYPYLATDGNSLYFDPLGTVSTYRQEPSMLIRMYLHSILHCIFRHPFTQGRFSEEAWSLACDILVESVALEMCANRFECEGDQLRRHIIDELQGKFGPLTPVTLAAHFEPLLQEGEEGAEAPVEQADDGLTRTELELYQRLFALDGHQRWPVNCDESDKGVSDRQEEKNSSDSDEQQRSDDATSLQGTGDGDEDQNDGGDSEQEEDDSPQESEDGAQSDSQGSGGSGGSGGESDEDQDDGEEGESDQDDSSEPDDEPDDEPDEDEPEASSSPDSADAEQLNEEWEDISKQVEMELESHVEQWGKEAGKLSAVLQVVNRKKYDYADFLRRFCVMAEDMKVNDDEFDYIYYTFGLDYFGNIPLVEPLEYMECERVREFVIVVDTSESCEGELIAKFIERTFDILKESETFTSEVNIHIVQCDARVQEDTKITNLRELESYLSEFTVRGLGGTDFRPAFEYVDSLVEAGEFENLRGLVYFTDGKGTYPEHEPAYDAAFVFLDDTGERVRVPPWAMKVIMDEEDIREL